MASLPQSCPVTSHKLHIKNGFIRESSFDAANHTQHIGATRWASIGVKTRTFGLIVYLLTKQTFFYILGVRSSETPMTLLLISRVVYIETEVQELKP